jgi:hypothetical protein
LRLVLAAARGSGSALRCKDRQQAGSYNALR